MSRALLKKDLKNTIRNFTFDHNYWIDLINSRDFARLNEYTYYGSGEELQAMYDIIAGKVYQYYLEGERTFSKIAVKIADLLNCTISTSKRWIRSLHYNGYSEINIYERFGLDNITICKKNSIELI